MTIQHSIANLLELVFTNAFNLLHCLATSSKDNCIILSKKNALKLFDHISSKDLDQLINTLAILQLEKEYLYYYHRLKCLPLSYMNQLIALGVLPSCFKTIKPPPYLAYLLGKSKKKL